MPRFPATPYRLWKENRAWEKDNRGKHLRATAARPGGHAPGKPALSLPSRPREYACFGTSGAVMC